MPAQTLEQLVDLNLFGPTHNDPADESWKGLAFFCLSCKQDDPFVISIAGAELDEVKRKNKLICLAELLKGEEFSCNAQVRDPDSELLDARFRSTHPYPQAMEDVPEGSQVDHPPSRIFWYTALARYFLQVKGQTRGNNGRRMKHCDCLSEEIAYMYGDSKTGCKEAPARQQ